MRDQSIGINLVGRDVSASKTLNKVGETSKKVSKALKLAGAAAGAFAIKLGKDSVAAAIADEKSQRMLNYTLKRAGWSALTDQVEQSISAMQMATGVSDTELRAAMVALTNATGDAAASQDLLKIAMDVSSGTGKDLGTTVKAISKLLVGQRKGLISLGTGIDATTMKTASLNEILDILETKFSGAAAASADTFSGKVARLREAIGEGKEAVGYALIDTFTQLAGNGDIDTATKKIGTFSSAVADMIRELGGAKAPTNFFTALYHDMAVGLVDDAKLIEKAFSVLGARYPALGMFAKIGDDAQKTSTALQKQNDQWAARSKALQDSYNQEQRRLAAAKAQAKADAAAAVAAKKLAASKAREAAARKKAADQAARELRLRQLAAKFDVTLIGLAAAKGRTADKDTLARLDALNVLAQDAAGLPVSDKALANASTQVNNITVNAGSILTEQDLLQKLALSMQAQIRRNDSGQIYWARL